jgi:hypothetical protein
MQLLVCGKHQVFLLLQIEAMAGFSIGHIYKHKLFVREEGWL